MKIDHHITTIEKAIAAHEALLTEAENKSTAEQAAVAASQAADAEKLKPLVEARASLRNKLNELTQRHAELVEALRIGKNQLTQQQSLEGEFDRLVTANFGNSYAGQNPGIFRELMTNRPASILALFIVPRLQAWITEKGNEIEAVEAEIAALAQNAKPPKIKPD
jgi:hypothetical protein